MKARHYLFGFSGRINRAKIWLWVLIVIAATIVAGAIVCFGFDWTATMTSLKAQHGQMVIDYGKVAKPVCKGTTSLVALILLGLIALAYVWAKLAIYTKRLHDRGKSAWWLLAYVALPIVLQGYACHTMSAPKAGAHPLMLHTLSLPGQIAHWAVILIGLWVFIDLFCLKGSKGANKYGPDPLEPNWCDPEKPVKGCVPKPMKGE